MRSEACGCPKVRFADLQTPAGGPRDLVLRVTMTPASNEVDAGSRRECRTTASTGPGRKIATVERREAGVLSSLENAGRRKHGARMPVMACTTGCSQHPGACRRSAIPSSGWRIEKANCEKEKGKEKGKGETRNEKRERLFVGWAKAPDGCFGRHAAVARRAHAKHRTAGTLSAWARRARARLCPPYRAV
jgi:hypothetical protein